MPENFQNKNRKEVTNLDKQPKKKDHQAADNLKNLIAPVMKPIENALLKLEVKAAATQGREGPKLALNKPLR